MAWRGTDREGPLPLVLSFKSGNGRLRLWYHIKAVNRPLSRCSYSSCSIATICTSWVTEAGLEQLLALKSERHKHFSDKLTRVLWKINEQRHVYFNKPSLTTLVLKVGKVVSASYNKPGSRLLAQYTVLTIKETLSAIVRNYIKNSTTTHYTSRCQLRKTAVIPVPVAMKRKKIGVELSSIWRTIHCRAGLDTPLSSKYFY